MSTMELIFEWASGSVSLIYFLTPLYEVVRIWNGSIDPESLPILLLVTIILNCLCWIAQGIFSKQHEGSHGEIWISVVIFNGIGFGVNFILLTVHLFKYLDKKMIQFLGYTLFLANCCAEIGYGFYRIQEYEGIIGLVATIVNMCMYASPIQNIVLLFKTRKHQFLPILTNCIGFISCVSWLVYGALCKKERETKIKTMVSNGVSLFVIVIQMGFWIYFYYNRFLDKKELEIDIEDGKKGKLVGDDEERPSEGEQINSERNSSEKIN